jgi:hypothetical protein
MINGLVDNHFKRILLGWLIFQDHSGVCGLTKTPWSLPLAAIMVSLLLFGT